MKAPFIGRERLRILLAKETTEIRMELKKALHGVYFSSTTDAWTANNHLSYTTCTVHFIDKRTWFLHRFALGIFKKTGTSKAEDVVSYCEDIWRTVDLDYNFLFCCSDGYRSHHVQSRPPYNSMLKGKWWNHTMAWLHWPYFRAYHQDCNERLWRIWGYFGHRKGSSWLFQQ